MRIDFSGCAFRFSAPSDWNSLPQTVLIGDSLPVLNFNALISINAVALHLAWLVLGWVTDCLWAGKLSHYVTSHPGQLSLAIPPWVGAMSTGDGYDHR